MMEVVRRIDVQPWMTAPETAAVMAALSGGAGEPQALFVGGCVRNALLGRSVDDIDIATRLTPDAATARLQKAGIRVVPTGLAHGTVTAVREGRGYEITTLRRDVETDGRHATVAFTEDWAVDAQRRDFTMNALFADAGGHIFDPTGEGLSDLDARRVRFVGDPAQRIAEDTLRVLRFFRFHAVYGHGAADAAALTACAGAADRIGALSRERITHEVLKILMADDPAAALGLMAGCDVLADMPGPGYDPAALSSLARLQAREGMPDAAARLALLDMPDAARDRYLILPRRVEKDRAVIGEDMRTQAGGKILIYRYGPGLAAQILLCRAAIESGDADLSLVKTWTPPRFPVTGDDVMKAGVPAGPQVGAVLNALEQWWIDRDFTPDRSGCLRKLKDMLES